MKPSVDMKWRELGDEMTKISGNGTEDLETWRPAKDDISACTWPMVTNEAALETSCRGERHEALGNRFTPPLPCKK